MNILILCRNYGNKNSSNGICVKNISKALQQMYNVKVYVISPDPVLEKNDGAELISIQARTVDVLKEQQSASARICRFVLKIIRYVISIFLYPNCDMRFVNVMFQTAKNVIQKEQIDCVIGFYRPFETIFVLKQLKKEFPKIETISYYLDVINGANNKFKIVSERKKYGGEHFFKRNYKTVDRVFVPHSFKLEKIKHESPLEKLSYVDFPLYINEIVPCEFKFNHDRINISFIGSLDINNRNPLGIIQMLRKLNTQYNMKLQLHIWGKIDGQVDKIIDSYADVVKYHGLIDNEYVSYIYSISDYLLNVCNAITTNMIPSKIFQMFASKRMILNWRMKDTDASRPYFEAYPGVIEIGNEEIDLSHICKVLQDNAGKELSFDESIFRTCNPDYIARCLLGANEEYLKQDNRSEGEVL